MLKQYFVKQGLKEAQIEEFIRNKFPDGNYSRMELQRTPLGIKVVIWSSSPGRIIGRGGRTINEMTDALKEKFKLENPQIDVKPVYQPDLDANIVAKNIALALERGFNFKRMGNIMLKRVMDAGAIGCQIIISGRASGGKAMTAKFIDGYIKHSGEQAKTLVDTGFEEIYRIGKSKPGKVGIKVKIMREFEKITGERVSSFKKAKQPGSTSDTNTGKSADFTAVNSSESPVRGEDSKSAEKIEEKKEETPQTEEIQETSPEQVQEQSQEQTSEPSEEAIKEEPEE